MPICTTTICLTLAISATGSTCEPIQKPVSNPIHDPAQNLSQGWASQYAKGVFPRVVQLRQRWGQLPDDLSAFDGFVATRQCDDIGDTVWLRPLGSKVWETFLIADCASKSDSRWQDGLSGYEWMLSKGVLVETDYKTAVRWETLHRGIQIELSRSCPPGKCMRQFRKHEIQ